MVCLHSRNNKALGFLAEARFQAKAIELGLTVSQPFGDNAKYDFIVDTGAKRLRIQVKSTYAARSKGCKTYKVLRSTNVGQNRVPYKISEVDFLAVHVVREDVWYIIPIRAIGGCKTINLDAGGHGLKNKYEKYREAWRLLEFKPQLKTGKEVTHA